MDFNRNLDRIFGLKEDRCLISGEEEEDPFQPVIGV